VPGALSALLPPPRPKPEMRGGRAGGGLVEPGGPRLLVESASLPSPPNEDGPGQSPALGEPTPTDRAPVPVADQSMKMS